jgi:hypothetical protein
MMYHVDVLLLEEVDGVEEGALRQAKLLAPAQVVLNVFLRSSQHVALVSLRWGQHGDRQLNKK